MRQGEGAIERNTLRGQSVSTNGTIINHIVLFNNRENPDIVSSRTSVFVRVYRLMCKLLGRKLSLQGVVALDRCSP